MVQTTIRELQRFQREAKRARRAMCFDIALAGLNLVVGIGMYASGKVGFINLILVVPMVWLAVAQLRLARRWERAAAAAR